MLALEDDLHAEPETWWLLGATPAHQPVWCGALERGAAPPWLLGIPLAPAAVPVGMRALPGPDYTGSAAETAAATERLFATAHARLTDGGPWGLLHIVDRSLCARPGDPAQTERVLAAAERLRDAALRDAAPTTVVITTPFTAGPCTATFFLSAWLADQGLLLARDGGADRDRSRCWAHGEYVATLQCSDEDTAGEATQRLNALADEHGLALQTASPRPTQVVARLRGHRFDHRLGLGPRFGLGGGYAVDRSAGGLVASDPSFVARLAPRLPVSRLAPALQSLL